MPELDSFLKGHVAKLEEYARELHYSMNQLPAPGERTPNQHAAGAGCTRTTPVKPTLVQALLVETPRKRNATDDVGTDHCTDFANLSKEEMEELIMMRYKDKIRNLRDKMLINSCKTKSKLPPPAVAQLSSWWSEHRIWPYPDDATKAQLIESTGLTSKQVTNWFINHRKRHWYKLFPGGIQPNSEEEAIQMLLASKDAPACGASSTPAPAPAPASASAGFSMPADVSGAASCPPPKKRRKKES